MSRLREVQSEFANAVFDVGRPPPAAIRRTVDGSLPTRRFSVYRNNVVMSLTEVLEAYFPVVRRLVGDEFFRATARAFIVAAPPASPVLSRYGAGLAEFLERFEPVSDLPYLPHIARLEWLQQRAYHAADAAPLEAAQLAGIAAEDVAALRFDFHPAARVLASPFPVFSIWRTNTFDTDVRPIGADAGPEAALIVRPHLEVQTLPISHGAAGFIERMKTGASIGEAFEWAAQSDDDFDLTATLAALIDLGALTAVTMPATGLEHMQGDVQ